MVKKRCSKFTGFGLLVGAFSIACGAAYVAPSPKAEICEKKIEAGQDCTGNEAAAYGRREARQAMALGGALLVPMSVLAFPSKRRPAPKLPIDPNKRRRSGKKKLRLGGPVTTATHRPTVKK